MSNINIHTYPSGYGAILIKWLRVVQLNQCGPVPWCSKVLDARMPMTRRGYNLHIILSMKTIVFSHGAYKLPLWEICKNTSMIETTAYCGMLV